MVDLSQLQGMGVLVLGHRGMLGMAVCRLLEKAGADLRVPLDNYDDGPVDFLEPDHVYKAVEYAHAEYILCLTGRNGGVGYRRGFDIFTQNTMVPLNLLQCLAERKRVRGDNPKVLFPLASCAYGHQLDQGNLCEEDFLEGSPHSSVDSHGYAKRAVFLACKKAAEQYGLRVITVCPPTLFGPGDRYGEDRAKIMAAMVRRFADAADNGLREVTCWGTGNPLRQFLYVEDAASIILQALLTYEDSSLPLNIGNPDWEFEIDALAHTVAEGAGYRGEIHWDLTRPDGQFRKRLNLVRQHEILGMQTFTELWPALKATLTAYRCDRDAGTLR